MIKILKYSEFLVERISNSDATQAESIIDRIFRQFNIDVDFTNHFKQRLNDPRNSTEISVNELIEFFEHAASKVGSAIGAMPIDFEAVLKEIATHLNIPFVLSDENRDGIKELVAKTVMRKEKFHSSNKSLEF